ncbi:hypothetical protein A3767_31555 [Oleiphilus sp. HI0133]|nr:hypothetical protein A3767_31555 [Oleiphilus sp. HI0133]
MDELKHNLLQHLHQPVRWADSIRYLISRDAGQFVECGPGKVLAGLNKRIDRSVTSYAISDIESIEATKAVLQGEGA